VLQPNLAKIGRWEVDKMSSRFKDKKPSCIISKIKRCRKSRCFYTPLHSTPPVNGVLIGILP